MQNNKKLEYDKKNTLYYNKIYHNTIKDLDRDDSLRVKTFLFLVYSLSLSLIFILVKSNIDNNFTFPYNFISFFAISYFLILHLAIKKSRT